jgi:hypothetical protein
VCTVLRMTLRIRQLAGPAETPVSTEQPFGVLTRAFDDPPEINRQQNIVFAIDYRNSVSAIYSATT